MCNKTHYTDSSYEKIPATGKGYKFFTSAGRPVFRFKEYVDDGMGWIMWREDLVNKAWSQKDIVDDCFTFFSEKDMIPLGTLLYFAERTTNERDSVELWEIQFEGGTGSWKDRALTGKFNTLEQTARISGCTRFKKIRKMFTVA